MKTYLRSIRTDKELDAVERLVNRLYSIYDSVKCVPCGLDAVKITCKGRVTP